MFKKSKTLVSYHIGTRNQNPEDHKFNGMHTFANICNNVLKHCQIMLTVLAIQRKLNLPHDICLLVQCVYMLLYTYNLYVHSHFDEIRPQTYTPICAIIIHKHTHTISLSLLNTPKEKNLIINNTIFPNMIQLPVHMRCHTTFISFNILCYIYNRQSNLFVLSII
jgi:hypothetical protein